MAGDKPADAARRRRWVTLGEILAVAAVAISAMTLWDSHQDRVRAEEKATAAATREDAAAASLILRATPAKDGEQLALAPLDAGQTIQTQTIIFPAALGITPIETAGDPRIEAGWIEDGLKRALKAAGRKEEEPGDQRLPVVVVTHYLAGGRPHTARTINDLGYTLEGRFLRGTTLVLRGMSIVGDVSAAKQQARLDSSWRRHGVG